MKRKSILISVCCLIVGFAVGYLAKPTSIVKTEFKTIKENVSVCSQAFSNYEKAVCFAKDSCYGMINDFVYDGLRDKTTFNCKK